MKDKYFDQLFARKFGQLPGEPHNKEGWDNLSRRLDQYERRRRNWVLPLLLSLFGLLAAGNIFWWLQWQDAVKKSSGNQITLSKTDTVMQSTVVYRYDTIYQNITLLRRQTAERITSARFPTAEAASHTSSFSNAPLASGDTATRENPVAGIPATVPGADSPAQLQDAAASNVQNLVQQQHVVQHNTMEPGQTVIQEGFLDTVAQVPLQRAAQEASRVDSLSEHVVEPALPTKKIRTPLFFLARPRLGLSIGWSSPQMEHKHSGSMFGAGVGADVEIAKNMRLAADVNYWQGKLKANEVEALDDVDIPSPGNDYKLKYWEIYRLHSISYAVQLRYQIPLKQHWKPWLGLGLQAATLLPFEVEFEFKNQVNSIEMSLYGEVEKRTQWQGILAVLGIERSFGSRFSLSAEAWLVRGLGEDSNILEHQIGLKTRFYYNF